MTQGTVQTSQNIQDLTVNLVEVESVKACKSGIRRGECQFAATGTGSVVGAKANSPPRRSLPPYRRLDSLSTRLSRSDTDFVMSGSCRNSPPPIRNMTSEP